jgi:crossover junction endodeoxyribonuclease RuvC
MRILGLDPGSRASGFGLIEIKAGKAVAFEFNVWRASSANLGERLASLFGAAEEILRRSRPEAVSIETVFPGKSAAAAVALFQARGVLLLAAARAGVPIFEYEPLTVKKAVTGYGRAEKPQVRSMVLSLLGAGAQKIPLDAADALAVALCHGNHVAPDF